MLNTNHWVFIPHQYSPIDIDVIPHIFTKSVTSQTPFTYQFNHQQPSRIMSKGDKTVHSLR